MRFGGSRGRMMTRKRLSKWIGALAILALVAVGLGMASRAIRWMGLQPDGSFVVSTGQRIEGGSFAFNGRPIELALHPTDRFLAVMRKSGVFLLDPSKDHHDPEVSLEPASAGFRGLAWTPDGSRLFASTDKGYIQEFLYQEGKLSLGKKVRLQDPSIKENPVPGGLAITRDGSRMYVAAANLNAIVELNLATLAVINSYPVENLPFEPVLSQDEKTLIASNWGGRLAKAGERTGTSDKLELVVDEREVTASGSISLIDRATGTTRHVEVGLHPTAIAMEGGRCFVANAMSDSISEVDIASAKVVRTIQMTWGDLGVLGAMPNALALRGKTLYVADGGDNALAEVDIESGKVKGYRPVGYFPTAVQLSKDGKTSYVLNTKGNGSVSKTALGKAGNAHDFQGTVTTVDLSKDLASQTEVVARNNRWDAHPVKPSLKVYNGAIKHVLYIIKENRTYDEVFGDLPIGNGDPKLCSLGEIVMPNHRKIAREFTLFDNGYVSGTNSADGHNWSTQALANEYLEHFYVGYSRTYPCEGEDPMSISAAGAIWDAALKKGKTLRVWGEFCDEDKAVIEPKPKDWFEVWDDRQKKSGKFKFQAVCDVPSLRPYIHPNVLYWPLLQSDQQRADLFIDEYQELSKKDAVPSLMILSLPADHGEGTSPQYPTPRAMMADNDLALGRVVEAISNSAQWKETCIFVIEDDAQSGPDHVDGHRTVFMAISPYNKRKYLDSSFYTTTGMIRSIELMLGLDAMNRFDALSDPMVDCFSDELDLSPFKSVPNNVPLDERNPSRKSKNVTSADLYWLEKSESLDWSKLDAADPYWLNRINWYSIYKGSRPYPGRPGEAPGQGEDDGDDDDR
jgi:DNA-binding beta-propeller fold protein YncE